PSDWPGNSRRADCPRSCAGPYPNSAPACALAWLICPDGLTSNIASPQASKNWENSPFMTSPLSPRLHRDGIRRGHAIAAAEAGSVLQGPVLRDPEGPPAVARWPDWPTRGLGTQPQSSAPPRLSAGITAWSGKVRVS